MTPQACRVIGLTGFSVWLIAALLLFTPKQILGEVVFVSIGTVWFLVWLFVSYCKEVAERNRNR